MRGARPFYRGETGKRRGGWNAFFDDPTSHPDGTRHVQSTLRAARRRRAQHWRAGRDPVRRLAHGQLRRRPCLHLLSRQPARSPGSRDDHVRAGRGVLLRRRPRHGGAIGSPARQQHAHRGGALRHRRRVAAHDSRMDCRRSACRCRRAIERWRCQDRRRQRGGVSVAAPVLFPARFHVESGLRLASRVARARVARHPAAPRRELAVLPLGQRAARAAAAHGRVLSALGWRARDGARARAPLHERRSLSTARRLQDAQHALASRVHRPGDGQRVRVDAAVQAGAEGDGCRRVDDHGLPRRRASRAISPICGSRSCTRTSVR